MNLLQELELASIAYKKIITSTTGFENQVNKLREYLFNKYLSTYIRNNAGLSDLLNGKGGNCEAQTKLVIDAFTSSEIQMPKGHFLGVQQFKDHIQPVIYNSFTNTVWELISGKIVDEIIAPIYAPPILFHAYLLGQGVAPVIPIKDLLIIDIKLPEEKQNSGGYSTNTELVFQGGKGYYSDEAVPEQAEITFNPIQDYSKGIYSTETKRTFMQKIKAFFSKILKH